MIYELSEILFTLEKDTIIPFEIKYSNGDVKVGCYPTLQNLAKEFLEKYEKNPFSSGAIDFLIKKLNITFSAYGYVFENAEENQIRYEFVCLKDTKLNTKRILASSRVLENGVDDDSLFETGIDRTMNENDDYPYLAVGTVINGRVVSICSENSHFQSDNTETEIGIETAEGFRNNGYALSNTALLCQKLLEEGKRKIIY